MHPSATRRQFLKSATALTGNLNLEGLLSVVATSGDFLSVAAGTDRLSE